MTKKERAKQQADAIALLNELRAPNANGQARSFHCEVTHVSSSGMSRHIAVFLPSFRTDTQLNGTKRETIPSP